MAEFHTYPMVTSLEEVDTFLVRDIDDTAQSPDGSTKQCPISLARETVTQSLLLAGEELADQIPAGIDTPMQVKFGAAQGTGGDPVMIDALGAVTFNLAGYYRLRGTFSVSRSGGSQVAELWLRLLINGVQQGVALACESSEHNVTIPLQYDFEAQFSAGQVVTVEFVRDSNGNNDGLLESQMSSNGWGNSPSASIRIYG